MSERKKVINVNARNFTKRVDCGGGAVMTIINPKSFDDGGLEWLSRYGSAQALEDIRYVVASVLGSYDYLLSGNITRKEAERRLALMRNERKSK